MRILVLGQTGMLGHTLAKRLSEAGHTVFATTRKVAASMHDQGKPSVGVRLIGPVDVMDDDALEQAFDTSRPDWAINCIGVVKQLSAADDPLTAIPINSLLPHRLAALAQHWNSKVLQISTDCVFSGKRGNYNESDIPDAADLYGRSKLLGELFANHCVTLRTSIIGHELGTRHSLLEWFLSQETAVDGYSSAVFSGFPTVIFADIIDRHVLQGTLPGGLYHVASAPISKLALLSLIASTYGKSTQIRPSERVWIDRSLDGSNFCQLTGFVAPDWQQMIRHMHAYG